MSTETIQGIGTVQFTRFPTDQAVVDAYDELILALKEIMYKDVNTVTNSDGDKLIETMNALKSLATGGLQTGGGTQLVTSDMMRQIDLLNRSLVSVGIGTSADRVDVLRWKDMGIDGFDALLTRAGFAVDTNRSLQALVEQEYIRTANEVLSSQLNSLYEALSATKKSIEILTDLQGLHNQIEPKDLAERTGVFALYLPIQERTKAWNTSIFSVLTDVQKNTYSNFGYIIDSVDKLMAGNGGVRAQAPLDENNPFIETQDYAHAMYGLRFTITHNGKLYNFTPDGRFATAGGASINGMPKTHGEALQGLFNDGYFGDPVELANQGKTWFSFSTKSILEKDIFPRSNQSFTFEQYRELLDNLGYDGVTDTAIHGYMNGLSSNLGDASLNGPTGVNIPWILALAINAPVGNPGHTGGAGGQTGNGTAGWPRDLQIDRDKAFKEPVEIVGGGSKNLQDIVKDVTLARIELAKELEILDKLTPPGSAGRDPNSLAGKVANVLQDLQTALGPLPVDFTNIGAQTDLLTGIADWLVDNQNAAAGTAGADKAGDIQRNLTQALTAATNLNDRQKEDFRRFMFVFEEYYKSASAVLNKLNQIIERMAQNAGR